MDLSRLPTKNHIFWENVQNNNFSDIFVNLGEANKRYNVSPSEFVKIQKCSPRLCSETLARYKNALYLDNDHCSAKIQFCNYES